MTTPDAGERGGLHGENQYRDQSNLAARQSLLSCITAVSPIGNFLDHLDWDRVDSVLDVGCGNGNFLGMAIERGGNAVGADLSQGMLAACRDRYGVDTQLVCNDAADLPYASDSFDAVLALWMLYHVPDRLAALREIRRVLRSEGQLLVITNGRWHYAELDDAVDRATTAAFGAVIERPAAAKAFTVEHAVDELTSVFGNVNVQPYRTELELHDPGPALTWYGSLREDIEPQLPDGVAWAGLERIIADEIQAVIDAHGVLRMHGLFVACTASL